MNIRVGETERLAEDDGGNGRERGKEGFPSKAMSRTVALEVGLDLSAGSFVGRARSRAGHIKLASSGKMWVHTLDKPTQASGSLGVGANRNTEKGARWRWRWRHG